MHHTIAIICTVLLLAGLALQVRQYVAAPPQAKPRMRIGLIAQTLCAALLIALNFGLIF